MFVYFGISTIFPSICVAVINVFILVGVLRSSRDRKKLVSKDSGSSEAEKRCLRNLVIISILYLIFMLPFGIAWGIIQLRPAIDIPIPDNFETIAIFSASWSLLNYCVNSVCYSFALPYYRKEAVKILTCNGIKREA